MNRDLLFTLALHDVQNSTPPDKSEDLFSDTLFDLFALTRAVHPDHAQLQDAIPVAARLYARLLMIFTFGKTIPAENFHPLLLTFQDFDANQPEPKLPPSMHLVVAYRELVQLSIIFEESPAVPRLLAPGARLINNVFAALEILEQQPPQPTVTPQPLHPLMPAPPLSPAEMLPGRTFGTAPHDSKDCP